MRTTMESGVGLFNSSNFQEVYPSGGLLYAGHIDTQLQNYLCRPTSNCLQRNNTCKWRTLGIDRKKYMLGLKQPLLRKHLQVASPQHLEYRDLFSTLCSLVLKSQLEIDCRWAGERNCTAKRNVKLHHAFAACCVQIEIPRDRILV